MQWHLALSEAFRTYLPPGKGTRKLLEIGCAPGRWLVWFQQHLHYQVSGCDFSPHGISLTRENLRLNGVEAELYQGDVFSNIVPEHEFDAVVSIGFIEHFTEIEAVVRRHIDFIKPGGYLALSVPNMAGKFNHMLLQLAGMQRVLSVHNLKVMRPEVFRSIAQAHDLDIVFLDYVGGFDPLLITANYHLEHSTSFNALPRHIRVWKKLRYLFFGKPFIIYPLLLLRKLFQRNLYFVTRLNNPCCSHMLLGIFRVPRE